MRHTVIIRRVEASIALVAAAIFGCSDDSNGRNFSQVAEVAATGTAPNSPVPPRDQRSDKMPGPDASPSSATAGRKIIYNATVDLVTEDLNALDTTLTGLVKRQKAYIADSERSGTAGATRHGTWKVRVPVDGYDASLKGVVALGELVSLRAKSQDVSEEYFDIDARLSAKKVEEARLLKHLADSTGKLEEILAVERELSRVRSEV